MPALLLDLDGTMLDTDRIHCAVFADLMSPFGIAVDEAHYRAHIHGRLNADYFAEMIPDHPDPRGLSVEKEARFRRRLPRPYPAMPGVAAMLERARDEGWALAVVTNAPPENADAMLSAIGLRHHFEVVVSGEACPRGKPFPDPYLAALDALGVAAAEALAFEDSPSGLAAAVAAGIATVGVTSTLTAADLLALGARATITDFTDPALAPLLDRLKGVPA
ncbi:HAD family hydrolase [Palleronia sp. KMU-117]|uniref:HAD family hydrolase n=1 Tax=Palleronia sp. KMU-117 TaxID=3434108 RepID=UPI003D7427C4